MISYLTSMTNWRSLEQERIWMPKLWNPVIRQALIAGYLKKDVENYGLLKLTAAGKRFIKNPEVIHDSCR